MIRYFDASALVKRYLTEPHSATVRRLLGLGPFATSRLSEVEVASALVRRCREGAFSTADRDRILRALPEDFRTMYVVEITGDVSQRTSSLLVRHQLRASDAIQLASSLYLQDLAEHPVRFVAFDARLTAAAAAEGLQVERW